MTNFLVAMLILALFAAPVGLFFYVSDIHHKGILDVKYPNVADGDWRTGWRRQVYLAGRKRGEFLVARDKERRRITRERRG